MKKLSLVGMCLAILVGNAMFCNGVTGAQGQRTISMEYGVRPQDIGLTVEKVMEECRTEGCSTVKMALKYYQEEMTEAMLRQDVDTASRFTYRLFLLTELIKNNNGEDIVLTPIG